MYSTGTFNPRLSIVFWQSVHLFVLLKKEDTLFLINIKDIVREDCEV